MAQLLNAESDVVGPAQKRHAMHIPACSLSDAVVAKMLEALLTVADNVLNVVHRPLTRA